MSGVYFSRKRRPDDGAEITDDGCLVESNNIPNHDFADECAHTQPDGRYHYHASPNALYEDVPTEGGSPVIGFAADGSRSTGPTSSTRTRARSAEATSGYSLKQRERPSGDGEPGGTYTGI